jgi:hypothetical protein
MVLEAGIFLVVLNFIVPFNYFEKSNVYLLTPWSRVLLEKLFLI